MAGRAARGPLRASGRLDRARPGDGDTSARRSGRGAVLPQPVPEHHPGDDRPPPPAAVVGQHPRGVVPDGSKRSHRVHRRRDERRPGGPRSTIDNRRNLPGPARHAHGPTCADRRARLWCHRGVQPPFRNAHGADIQRGRGGDISGSRRHRCHRTRRSSDRTTNPRR